MTMIDDLKKLSPLMRSHIARLVDDAMKQAATEGRRNAKVDVTLSRGSIRRAAVFFAANISDADEDVADAAVAFIHAWMLSETAALRRVMTAISSPEAKGREIEVVRAMMQGASIEEALSKRDSAQVTQSGSVVTFPSRGVASTSKDE